MRRPWFANGIEGRHVLFGLIAFFGVMLIANAIFVYFAVATFSGGDTSDPYRKGLHYNETLESAERQAERGWRTEVEYDDKTGRLQLSFVDKERVPIMGLRLSAMLSRPATEKEDRKVVLAEASQGVYVATVQLAPGLWVISVASRKAGGNDGSAYRLKRRLLVVGRP
jgi:nitrogen fixation protein FixH